MFLRTSTILGFIRHLHCRQPSSEPPPVAPNQPRAAAARPSAATSNANPSALPSRHRKARPPESCTDCTLTGPSCGNSSQIVSTQAHRYRELMHRSTASNRPRASANRDACASTVNESSRRFAPSIASGEKAVRFFLPRSRFDARASRAPRVRRRNASFESVRHDRSRPLDQRRAQLRWRLGVAHGGDAAERRRHRHGRHSGTAQGRFRTGRSSTTRSATTSCSGSGRPLPASSIPFVLVVEGSIPNENIKREGYWAGFGNNAPGTSRLPISR